MNIIVIGIWNGYNVHTEECTRYYTMDQMILDQLFGQLNTRYRRAQNVKYFDEIIEEWNRQ